MNGVALEYFNGLSPPDMTVEIDASDYGLCALDVSSKCALTYQFTPEERKVVAEFKATGDNGVDINYREFLSCVFAVHAWVSAGRTKHRKGRDRFTFTFASTTGFIARKLFVALLFAFVVVRARLFTPEHVPGPPEKILASPASDW
ncbi:uncharacterized protein IUM83_12357 [Phytophthora cinnamomi]|uniref:uncharacterized protein n=1 Tax=Phytophthora cinnamomi TaxID=4785 RepID=UPI00355A0C8F|nr:hypothetical protein IUM83_12357 [Phytophthora cinnamomi]